MLQCCYTLPLPSTFLCPTFNIPMPYLQHSYALPSCSAILFAASCSTTLTPVSFSVAFCYFLQHCCYGFFLLTKQHTYISGHVESFKSQHLFLCLNHLFVCLCTLERKIHVGFTPSGSVFSSCSHWLVCIS